MSDNISKVPCTWCLNGERKTWVPGGGHVVLFACVREHMTARPLCDECATERARLFAEYRCADCAKAGEDEDSAVCRIVLVTTRADWMQRLADGRVRFAGVPA